MKPTLAEYTPAAPAEGFIVRYLSDDHDPQPVAHCYTWWNAHHVVKHIQNHEPRTPDEAEIVVQLLASKYFENPDSTYKVSCGHLEPDDKFTNILWGPDDQLVATREHDTIEAAREDAIDMAKSASHRLVASNATIYSSARTPDHCWPGNQIGTARCGFYTPQRIEQINYLEKYPGKAATPTPGSASQPASSTPSAKRTSSPK